MNIERRRQSAIRVRWSLLFWVAALWVLLPCLTAAQGLMGALNGTVHDASEAAIPGAVVSVSSPELIGGPTTRTSDDKGTFRFSELPPGDYVLEIQMPGFTNYHKDALRIPASATLFIAARMVVTGGANSIYVEGAGSGIDVRNPGFSTNFGSEYLRAIPTRRSNFLDYGRWAPFASPTSPTSGTTNTLSVAGSATNENQFLFDGTIITCSCNGVARVEPGIDFIQEIQIQSVGASAEYGYVQGAVINAVTKQGSNRLRYDASYYGQPAGLASRPVLFPLTAPKTGQSGYERVKFQDFTTGLGGPVVRDRAWFYAGYQHQRDSDSQPGTDPAFPRKYEQDKIFTKLTWKPAQSLQLDSSFHDEFWVNPDRPTYVTPWEAIVRPHGSTPALNFHLAHTLSPATYWDVRVGRYVFSRNEEPNTGSLTTPSHFDRVTGVTSGGPPRIGTLTIERTTAKATLNHYQPGFLGTDHQWKVGVQVERGEHRSRGFIPTGVRYNDDNGQPAEAVSSPPSNLGGVFVTGSAFATDAISVGPLTISAGVRFDHTRAFHQDLPALDPQGVETTQIIRGQGTLYTWNLWSPRLGVAAKLTGDGRTILRSSWGRFSQGVLTGELEPFHPGATATTTRSFVATTGDYTGTARVVDPKINLQLDPHMRAPHTDEFSIGVDREVGRHLALSAAYVRKDGANFIGWTDVGGQYREETRTLADGRSIPVFVLTNAPSARRFKLTNPPEYSLTYNGFVMAVEKRRSHGWQAFGSYTFSKAFGLLPSSGTTAAGAQASTISPPQPLTFGRDPNDLTNARGLLPNDRPHMFRVMGSVDVPRTGVTLAANLQYFSGKPWAATAQTGQLPQGDLRILIEPRGSRRMSSQSPLDVRVSRAFHFGDQRVELLVDVLNVLNDSAEEGLATDNLFSANFNRPTIFMDPRRVMFGVRLNLSR
jgi:hypothetical protein